MYTRLTLKLTLSMKKQLFSILAPKQILSFHHAAEKAEGQKIRHFFIAFHNSDFPLQCAYCTALFQYYTVLVLHLIKGAPRNTVWPSKHT